MAVKQIFSKRITKLDPKNPKWEIILENFEEDNIPIFYGEDDNYSERILKWITNV